MILSSICCIAAPGNYNFNYEVHGRQITLQPNIDTSAYTHYKWEIQTDHMFSDTGWIHVDDIYDHVSTVDYNKTYVITLHVRTSTGGTYSTGKTISVSSSSGANDPYYTEETGGNGSESVEKTLLLGNLIPFLLGLHWSLQLLVCILLCMFVFILVYRKKHVIYFIKKK